MKQQHGVGMVLHIDRNIALAGTAAAVRLVDPNAPERAPDERAAFAAQFIPVGARVLELGCGRMALKRFLPNGCSYQGCDLVTRDDATAQRLVGSTVSASSIWHGFSIATVSASNAPRQSTARKR
jgi:hypothetical protein